MVNPAMYVHPVHPWLRLCKEQQQEQQQLVVVCAAYEKSARHITIINQKALTDLEGGVGHIMVHNKMTLYARYHYHYRYH